MVVTKLDLSALTPGTKLTVANTGGFLDTVQGGADRLTAAQVAGGPIGARTNPAGANSANHTLSTARQTRGMVGFKMDFTSSTTTVTSYYEMVALRFNTAAGFLTDLGLRHNSTTLKRFPAFRNNFAYIGQANAGNAYDLDLGERWSFELEWTGLASTARVWVGEDTSGTPTFTWNATMAQAPLNFMLGNDSSDGVDAILYDIWVSDGERPPGPVAPGTLAFMSPIWASRTEVVIVGKSAAATQVSVKVGGTTVSVTPDSAGYFRAPFPGLTAGTAYPWEILVDGVSRRTGSVTTLASTVDGHRLLFGSCFDTYGSPFFGLADAYQPDQIAQLGDYDYPYLNGVIASTDVALVRAAHETALTAAAPQALFTKYPTSYTYSDTDGAGANSDRTWQGFTSGAVQAAYRQQFAHPTLPLSDCGARSWTVGRIRFIQTDENTLASPKGDPQNTPGKTKLGVTQKAWFYAELDAAFAAGQSVVWLGDGPWIRPAALGGNEWAAYNVERVEIGQKIAALRAQGFKIIRLHGDAHSLFADNGTNNQFGGFPTACAAPMHTTANVFNQTVSNGAYPTGTGQINSSRHVGIADFSDDGTAMSVRLRGFSSTNSEPTQMERYNMLVDLTPGVAPSPQPWSSATLNGAPVSAMYLNGAKVWP